MAVVGIGRRIRAVIGAAAPPPPVVPALRAWRPSRGTFRLRPGARVVVRVHETRVPLAEARTLAADLGGLLGRHVAVGRHTRRGDVVVTLTARDAQLGVEGYSLRIGRAFTIAARSDPGIYYGGRTLLQLVRLGAPIPRGRARD